MRVRACVCVYGIIYRTTFLLRLSCHRRESGKSSHAIRAIYGDDRTTIVKRLQAWRMGDSLLLHLISHDAALDKKIGYEGCTRCSVLLPESCRYICTRRCVSRRYAKPKPIEGKL